MQQRTDVCQGRRASHITSHHITLTAAHSVIRAAVLHRTPLMRPCELSLCPAQVMYGIAVETQGAILDEISSLADSGCVRSHMHDCVSWKEYAAAFAILEARKTVGKVSTHHEHKQLQLQCADTVTSNAH